MSINDVSLSTIQREIKKIQLKGMRTRDIIGGDYENEVRTLLELIVQNRETFSNLSDLDKLVEFMMDHNLPVSARPFSDDRYMDSAKEIRKNTTKKAKEILELVDNDLEKALTVVKAML